MTRLVFALALVSSSMFSACHRGTATVGGGSAVPTDRAPFVGAIKEVRAGMIWVEEESATSGRRGNVRLLPSTEIVLRNGTMVPPQNLRRGMHATVFFRGAVDATVTAVSGTASRIVVDY